jgi:hypothetical protein
MDRKIKGYKHFASEYCGESPLTAPRHAQQQDTEIKLGYIGCDRKLFSEHHTAVRTLGGT